MPVTFPTAPGRYWARIATAGPATSLEWNAIVVIYDALPFCRLWIAPLEPQGDRGSRQWQPADVLAIGPPVDVPALK